MAASDEVNAIESKVNYSSIFLMLLKIRCLRFVIWGYGLFVTMVLFLLFCFCFFFWVNFWLILERGLAQERVGFEGKRSDIYTQKKIKSLLLFYRVWALLLFMVLFPFSLVLHALCYFLLRASHLALSTN